MKAKRKAELRKHAANWKNMRGVGKWLNECLDDNDKLEAVFDRTGKRVEELVEICESKDRLLRQCKLLAMKDDDKDSTVQEMHDVPLDKIPDFINSRIADLECEAADEPTWAEWMEVIDKRYPPEVFGKGSDDNTGPRIVALCREIESLQAITKAAALAIDSMTCEWPVISKQDTAMWAERKYRAAVAKDKSR